MNNSCRLCFEPCDLNNRLSDRNFREKAQDILVLHLKIDENNISTVCDSCQSLIDSFYQFKQKCRQNEKLRQDPNAALCTGFAIKDMEVVPPKLPRKKPRRKKPTGPPKKPPLPGKKSIRRSRYIKRTDRELIRFSKEQLISKTKKELYQERYRMVCEQCGKSFANKYNMAGHMNEHLGIRPYSCTFTDCEAKFYCAKARKGHILRCHSDDKVSCPDCGKVVNGVKALNNHRKIHLPRTIICQICNLRFRIRSQLKNHMLVHTQQRNHECQYCGKAFYAKQVLTLHVRSHTGERPYACHVCDFSHAHRILYVKHMQKYHPDDEIRTLAEIQKWAKTVKQNEQPDDSAV